MYPKALKIDYPWLSHINSSSHFLPCSPWIFLKNGHFVNSPVDTVDTVDPSEPLSFPCKRHKRLAARCRAGRSRKALAWPKLVGST